MKKLFFLSVFLIVFAACKKYPEGGWHYNAFRHLGGSWSLKLYEVDSIDSTYLTQGYNNIPNYLSDFLEIATVHSGNRTEFGWFSQPLSYSVYINKKNRDVIQLSGNMYSQQYQRNIFNPTNEQYFSWKIEKLTKDELRLTSVNYNYKLILIKK